MTDDEKNLALNLMRVTSKSELMLNLLSQERIRSGKRRILTSAGDLEVPSLREFGFRTFGSLADLRIALRAEVMLKMMRQAHDAELLEPGEPALSGIVGTPEW